MPEGSFTLAATGDAIIAHPIAQFGTESGQFEALVDVLQSADAAVTQVEPVVIDDQCRHGSLAQVADQYQYLAPFPGALMGTEPEMLDELRAMGLNLFTAASNHATDFGRDGLETTLTAMRERDLTVAGIGRDRGEARRPSYLRTDAGRVGLVDATTSVPPGGAAGVSTDSVAGSPGVNPLHVEWTYRVEPEQLAQLRRIAEATGIEAVKGEWLRRENPDWERDDAFYFMQMRFAAAADQRPPGIYQSLRRPDRDAVLTQVRAADANADWTVVGLHSHQSSGGDRNKRDAPAFVERFARDSIDAGADAVVVTGPHTLRGIEVYQGRPICYSLGNLFFQEDVFYRIPDGVAADADATVPDVRGAETDTEVDHGADNWRSVVPECVFDESGSLDQMTLYPCYLQPAADGPRRGVPALATGERATSILRAVRRRSDPYGTAVRIDGDIGVVDCA